MQGQQHQFPALNRWPLGSEMLGHEGYSILSNSRDVDSMWKWFYYGKTQWISSIWVSMVWSTNYIFNQVKLPFIFIIREKQAQKERDTSIFIKEEVKNGWSNMGVLEH